jgi:hypothetical protein
MVRDLSAGRRSMLHELPVDLVARVERNHIWMDTYRSNRGMAALMEAHQSSGEEEEEAKVGEVISVQETDTIEEEGPYGSKNYPTAAKGDDQDPNKVQQEPPVDPTYCCFWLHTSCLFLQWQDKLERCVDIM